MCGIWGISDTNGNLEHKVLGKVIERLMLLSETRGKDASGIAIMQECSLNVFRKAMSSSKILKDRQFQSYIKDNILSISDSNVFIAGHSRLVTNGTQYNPNNNQPVAKKNIALVHNGIVVNERKLWDKLSGADKEYDVDSEVILEIFYSWLNKLKNVKEAIEKTYSELEGMSSTIILMQPGHYMIASSNNGSLYRMKNKDGSLNLFASESLTLMKLLDYIPELKKIMLVESLEQITRGKNIILCDKYTGDINDVNIIQDTMKSRDVFNCNLFNYNKYEIDFDKIRKIRRCTKCVLPETMPFIEFDENGVCNYCRGYRKVKYKGKDKLREWNKKYHRSGKKAMVSFSGGRDSSYGLHYFVNELGITPMAYCYDWGMVTDLARRNQARMCEQLGVEMIVVSADIKKKRHNIRKNVEAWLKKPSLGMIPLFMAGDKHYFYYANKVRSDYDLDVMLLASNPFEKTYFKSGYCGVKPDILKTVCRNMDIEHLDLTDVFLMSKYYINQFCTNTSYLNTSIKDTISAAISYYIIPHNYFRLFDYIPWDEKEIDNILINQYQWECAEDTQNTWRIGDGTAPFYNYIYCVVAGFTENDTLRSNQIREGMLTRDEALALVYRDNQPRFESMKWYFDAINLNMKDALDVIVKIPKLYIC